MVELDSELFALQVPRSGLPGASLAVHDELHRCAGFVQRTSLEKAMFRRASEPALQVTYAIDNAATVTPLLAEVRTENLLSTIETLSAFPTRLHDSEEGLQAALWIRDLWQGYAEGRADVSVELVEHENTPQPSVAATITGATLPNEVVVLGGHLDSINGDGPGELAPGADDNASGIAVLSEALRAALELGYRPDRTVIFYGYAAEEIGLVGSEEIAQAAEDSGLDVVGVLQLDMTNYSVASQPYLALITDYTTPSLNELGKQLIDEYLQMPWEETECGYGCSDHASWYEHGFPVHYVHESNTDESNPYIHTTQDTLALSEGMADHSLHFARYSVAFMAEVAKGTIPPEPECDATRPCPAGETCQAGTCVANGGGAGGSPMTGGMGGGGAGGGATLAGASGGGVGGSGGSPAAGGPPQGGSDTARLGPASTPTSETSDCSCRAPGRSGSAPSAHWLLVAAAYIYARRRITQRSASSQRRQ